MYCKNCGNKMDDLAVICVKCGAAKGTGANFCPNCGGETQPGAQVCTHCGVPLAPLPTASGEQKSKMAAGLLGIFLGGFGIHNFYLGFESRALVQLLVSIFGIVLSVFTCGVTALATTGMAVWGLVEGILILTGSVKTDAKGMPLKD